MLSRGRIMDTSSSMAEVTPLIQLCRVILSRMVKSYCSQSSIDPFLVFNATCALGDNFVSRRL